MNQTPCILDQVTRRMIQIMIDAGTPKQEAFDIVMDLAVRS